jgi:hypothetical protein
MNSTLRNQDIGLFSESPSNKEIEVNFVVRLMRYIRGLTVDEIHRLVNSGEFNEIFPALDDEATRVPPRRFEDLKPFDYRAWAERNRLKE